MKVIRRARFASVARFSSESRACRQFSSKMRRRNCCVWSSIGRLTGERDQQGLSLVAHEAKQDAFACKWCMRHQNASHSSIHVLLLLLPEHDGTLTPGF